VEFTPLTPTKGNLLALCEVCAGTMRKHVSTGRLPELRPLLTVKIRQAPTRLIDSPDPCLNIHLDGGS
jgi:hypothetical protein